jgi:hypothetical protein
MHELISYQDAKLAGDKFYFTGKPCRRGHIEQRLVSSCACVACAKLNYLKWREENPERDKANKLAWEQANPGRKEALAEAWRQSNLERFREKQKLWREANADRVKGYQDAWRANNPEKRAAISRAWRANNPEAAKAAKKRWQEANPAKHKAADRRKHARRRHTVNEQIKQLTTTELAELSVLYQEAAMLGPDWHVDHIVPLARGGDHRPYNLQIVKSDYNAWKNAQCLYTPADLGKHLPAHYAEAAM